MKYFPSIIGSALARQFGSRFGTLSPQQGSFMSLFDASFFSTSSTRDESPLQSMYDQLDSIPDLSASVRKPLLCPNIKAAMDLMASVSLDDLGVSMDQVHAMDRNYCSTIIEKTDNFEIAVFFLSAGRSLPIHDHPDMAVLSKVIHGELSMQSYSPSVSTSSGFASSSSGRTKSSRTTGSVPVRLEANCKKSLHDPAWFLSPSEGNYHVFSAVSNCVVLDVLLPPYDEVNARSCTYYSLRQPSRTDAKPGTSNLELVTCTGNPFSSSADVPILVPYSGTVPRRRVLPRFKATY